MIETGPSARAKWRALGEPKSRVASFQELLYILSSLDEGLGAVLLWPGGNLDVLRYLYVCGGGWEEGLGCGFRCY